MNRQHAGMNWPRNAEFSARSGDRSYEFVPAPSLRQDRTMPPTVHDDPDQSRYVIEVDGGDSGGAAGAPAGPAGAPAGPAGPAGFTEYHLHDGVIAFLHTEVDPAHQGEGLATTLIRGALDD